jgi:hypothetical protein
VELAVGGRAPGAVKEWCERANAELDRFSAEKLAAAATDPGDEPDDVPEEVPVEAPPEEVTAEPVEEAPHDDPRDRLADVEFDEAPESTVNPGTVEGEVQS